MTDFRVLITLFLALLLNGCAFGTRNALLIYPPASSDTTSAVNADLLPTKKNIQVVLTPFSDQRTEKKLVGTVRNGYGMRTADVIPQNSVEVWVMQAFSKELVNNGYTVLEALPKDASAGITIVSGEILNVFCDMFFTYTGQVSLTVKANKDNKEILNKHYSGEGSAGMAFAATGESYAQSLALALSVAIKQFVSELDKTIGITQQSDNARITTKIPQEVAISHKSDSFNKFVSKVDLISYNNSAPENIIGLNRSLTGMLTNELRNTCVRNVNGFDSINKELASQRESADNFSLILKPDLLSDMPDQNKIRFSASLHQLPDLKSNPNNENMVWNSTITEQVEPSAISKDMLKEIAKKFIALMQKDNVIASNCGTH